MKMSDSYYVELHLYVPQADIASRSLCIDCGMMQDTTATWFVRSCLEKFCSIQVLSQLQLPS